MSSLYLFNPENDLALANDSPHFTPPAAAVDLSRTGACLPAWSGNQGDYFIGCESDGIWVSRLNEYFDIKPQIFTDKQTDYITDCRPWGWSRYTKQKFIHAGICTATLPDDATLDHHRILSHRRNTIKIFKLLDGILPYPLPPIPTEASDMDVVRRICAQSQRIFIKSPWSGSGRGIIDSSTAPERQVLRLAEGVMKRQGSVLIEQGLDKICDFAMLFDINKDNVEFVGYSSFFNLGFSTYSGNVLMSDDRIAESLAKQIPTEWLEATVTALTNALKALFCNSYKGPLGVDMMLYKHDGKVLIAPCIEINTRMTMGRVAHTLFKRYISRDRTGRMQILKGEIPELMNISHNITRLINGRMSKGTVALTPPTGNAFTFVMSVD